MTPASHQGARAGQAHSRLISREVALESIQLEIKNEQSHITALIPREQLVRHSVGTSREGEESRNGKQSWWKGLKEKVMWGL